MKKILTLIILTLILTGCSSKRDVISANLNSSEQPKYQVNESLVSITNFGGSNYNYSSKIDLDNNIFKTEFVFEMNNHETSMLKYSFLDNNAIKNFISTSNEGEWFETNETVRTNYFLEQDHIRRVSKSDDYYIVSVYSDVLELYLKEYEANIPFDFEYLNSLGSYDIKMFIEDDLVKMIEVDLLDLVNTDDENIIEYESVLLKINYNYDDIEIIIPEGIN